MDQVKRSAITEEVFVQVHTDDGRVLHLRLSAARHSARLTALVRAEQEELEQQRQAARAAAETSAAAGTLTALRVVATLSARLDSTLLTRRAFLAVGAYLEAADGDDAEGAAAAEAAAVTRLDELAERLVAFHYMGVPAVTALLARVLGRAVTEAVTPHQARVALGVPAEDYRGASALADSRAAGVSAEDPLFRDAWPADSAQMPVVGGDDDAIEGSGGRTPQLQTLQTVQPLGEEEETPQLQGHLQEQEEETLEQETVQERVRERRREVAADPDRESCFHCRCRVGTALRPRHVCASCGGTFCGEHCARAPADAVFAEAPAVAAEAEASWLARVRRGVRGRMLCSECGENLAARTRTAARYERALRAAALPVAAARRLGTLSALLRGAAARYLRALAGLQHRLPTEPLTALERRMVFGSRRTFAGHALWSLQLLRATRWDDCVQHHEVAALLCPETLPACDRPRPCAAALCTAPGCTGHGLTPLDCAAALDAALFPVPPDVRALLVARLRPASTAQLLPLLPQLVRCIRYDSRPQLPPPPPPPPPSTVSSSSVDKNDDIDEDCPLSAFLFERATTGFDAEDPASVQFVAEYYWRLGIEGYECVRIMLIAALAQHTAPAARALASSLAAEHTLTTVVRGRSLATLPAALHHLAASGHLRVPVDFARCVVAVPRVVELPAVWSPLLLDLQEEGSTTHSVAFVAHDATFGVLLRALIAAVEPLIDQDREEQEEKLTLVPPRVCATARGCAYVDAGVRAVACRGHADFTALFRAVAALAPARPCAALLRRMVDSAAFYAAFSFVFGLAFDDFAVAADGTVRPADLACRIPETLAPAHLVPLPLLPVLAARTDFVARCVAHYARVRTLGVHVCALLHAVFDHDRAVNATSVLAERFARHVAAHACTAESPAVGARALERLLASGARSVVDEAHFAHLRSDTAKTLTQCLYADVVPVSAAVVVPSSESTTTTTTTMTSTTTTTTTTTEEEEGEEEEDIKEEN